MADIAVGVLFVLTCASLYGLAVYLFRDQIWPEKYPLHDARADTNGPANFKYAHAGFAETQDSVFHFSHYRDGGQA
jgi:hypothetical protein